MNVPCPNAHAEALAAPADLPRWATGVVTLDAALNGGFVRGRVHEVYAADSEDVGGTAGFAVLLASGLAGQGEGAKPLVWLHERRAVQVCGIMQAEGLVELGGLPHNCLLVQTEDRKALLRASLDAARCAGLGAVVIQGQGPMPELDLTASRRLSLATQRSGVTLLVLRIGAEPVPSAAETRWAANSAPSQALAGNATGLPTFDIELLRQRSGPSGMRWRLEWDRDRSQFRDTAIPGAVVPVPLSRPAADSGTGSLRPIANRAA